MQPFPPKSAATHSGPFHADDVVVGAFLATVSPDIVLTRTRDAATLATHAFVYDVGGRYDRDAGRFDHHFRPQPALDDGTLLSSAGLVWRDLGHALVAEMGVPPQARDAIHAALESRVVRLIDAVDTGSMRGGSVPTWLAALPAAAPTWEEQPSEPAAARAALDAAYRETVDVVAAALRRVVVGLRGGAEAEQVVTELLEELSAWGDAVLARSRAALDRVMPFLMELRRRHGASEEPVLLPTPGLPWGPIFATSDEESGPRPYQVMFRDLDGVWIVQSATVPGQRSVSRIPFPPEWGGLQGEALAHASGIADAVFCHPACFIAGFGSESSARRAAALARRAVVGRTQATQAATPPDG